MGAIDALVKHVHPRNAANSSARLERTGQEARRRPHGDRPGLAGGDPGRSRSHLRPPGGRRAFCPAFAARGAAACIRRRCSARRRIKKFSDGFPKAIDLIVRGLKSGLPVTELIMTVSKRDRPARSPSNSSGSATASSSAGRSQRRLRPAPSAWTSPNSSSSSSALGIQHETGGNLAETLGNLQRHAAPPPPDEAEDQGVVVGSARPAPTSSARCPS